jgi:hypothetical protein
MVSRNGIHVSVYPRVLLPKPERAVKSNFYNSPKRLGFFRGNARKKRPREPRSQSVGAIHESPLLRPSKVDISYKHVCINEALSAYWDMFGIHRVRMGR